MTQGIQQGENPEGVTAFRGLAYLGAKADEQIGTQRFLWETAAGLRYEKTLILAKRNWTEERKVKVAGFNGRYGMESLWGKDLDGQYIVEIQPDSSRPMTLSDKEQMIQMLLQGGMIDPMDPEIRERVLDMANMDGLNLVNEVQYRKAERDLDSVRRGQMPAVNPYIDLQIHFKLFSTFTLTEEFENDPPQAQQAVLTVTGMMSQQLQAQQAAQAQAAMAMAAQNGAKPGPGAKLAGAMKKKQQNKQSSGLNGVPGSTQSADQSGQDALAEGNQLAAGMP
jgi:hypothetical protein